MKKVRSRNEDLAEMLKELKVGDDPIFDSVTNFEISKVPSGYIYMHEFVGAVFVPDSKTESVGHIKNSVAKTEPKRVVKK